MAVVLVVNLTRVFQMNVVTHYLDMSLTYGSSDADARLVRSYGGGLLKYQNRNGQILMPHAERELNAMVTSKYQNIVAYMTKTYLR